jgi:hypothetical protein
MEHKVNFFFVGLGMEPRASHMLTYSTELYSKLFLLF